MVTREGVAEADGTETDLATPARGLFDLEVGRLPRDRDEVVVTPTLAARGPGSATPSVSPVAAGAPSSGWSTRRQCACARRRGPVGSLGLNGSEGPWARGWWAHGPGDLGEVQRLNALGGSVVSRAVVTDPPPPPSCPRSSRRAPGRDPATLTVLALVVVMVLLEVVLLAGPAFAVGARRQQRTLALLGATGATPRHVRRVVLANGVVLGASPPCSGRAGPGCWAGRCSRPVQRLSRRRGSGPSTSACATWSGSPCSACSAPCWPRWCRPGRPRARTWWRCSAGRRGDRPAGVRSPLLGCWSCSASVWLLARVERRSASGETAIASRRPGLRDRA